MNWARSFVLIGYVLLVTAGMIFIDTPSQLILSVITYAWMAVVWSSFFIIGGITAAFGLICRSMGNSLAGFYYFEVAGAVLLAAGAGTYASALFEAGIRNHSSIQAGVGFVVTAFCGMLLARAFDLIIEVRRKTRLVEEYGREHSL